MWLRAIYQYIKFANSSCFWFRIAISKRLRLAISLLAKMKNGILIFLGIGCFLIVGIWAASIFFTRQSEVSIVNKATESVVKGEIGIGNQRFIVENMKPGEQKTFSYKVTSDSHYSVAVTLSSGRRLATEIGYVTTGLDFKETLIVNNDAIELAP